MPRFPIFHFPAVGLLAILGCMPIPPITDKNEQTEQEKLANRDKAAAEVAKHRDGFRALVGRSRGLVPLCAAGDAKEAPPLIRGKVLIWDVTVSDISEAHLALPDEIRASDPQSATAVILILKQERKELPIVYSEFGKQADQKNGPRGIRIDAEVCVLDLVRQQPLGYFHIQGQQPP